MMKAISGLSIGALAAIMASCLNTEHSASARGERYSWKKNIVTTVFWIGERPSGNNPVPNRVSSWDKNWSRSYGGFDDPNPAHRNNYWQYVFGSERPKPNLNKGAGLDVSPAVRDYLGLDETDVTDWRFVEFSEVSHGPWSTLGKNNTL